MRPRPAWSHAGIFPTTSRRQCPPTPPSPPSSTASSLASCSSSFWKPVKTRPGKCQYFDTLVFSFCLLQGEQSGLQLPQHLSHNFQRPLQEQAEGKVRQVRGQRCVHCTDFNSVYKVQTSMVCTDLNGVHRPQWCAQTSMVCTDLSAT